MALGTKWQIWGSVAMAGAIAGCGGSDSGENASATEFKAGLPASPARQTSAANQPPPLSVACAVDTTVALSYEEQRLTTPLPNSGPDVIGTDATPLADRILKDTGFDNFAPTFATLLCDASGETSVSSYESAIQTVKTQGALLWRAAVDRAQGRRASSPGSVLPNSDDRMLYWARLQMTKALRQWQPSYALTALQKEELQWQFERASRGQYDIKLPEGHAPNGARYRRLILSGFDVFTLGIPGTPNTGLRNGNPSGAAALAMDGKQYELVDGSILHVETYFLPVSYDPFNRGMQEDTLGPYFRPGPQRVDASLTLSQGSQNVFNLEQFNARFHGPSAGNDGIVYCPPGDTRLPHYVLEIGTVTREGSAPISLPGSGCNIYPPERWLGYDSVTTWFKDFPPQYVNASLPVPAMVTSRTNVGVPRPPGATSQGTEGFDVTWHTNYSYFPDCMQLPTESVPSNGVLNGLPDLTRVSAPDIAWCSRSGGGGDYLSNESAYRNTLLRDVFGVSIPAGHIHVPVLNNFLRGTPETGGGARDDNAVTDARFEAYRTAIVAQSENLVIVVGNSLTLSGL